MTYWQSSYRRARNRAATDNKQLAKVVEKVGSGRASVTTMNRIRKKRNRTGWTKPKVKKKSGFNAFASKRFTPDGKTVISTEAVEPETGIHSRAWAEQIVPQSGFLSLPIELRSRIYGAFLEGGVIHNPRKNGKKFTTNKADLATIKVYLVLAQICRQAYVDVVGGGLLYAFAQFNFSSTYTMTQYLSCINPAHKAAIRKIAVVISLTQSSPAIPAKVFATLGSVTNLRSLKLDLLFSFGICQTMPRHHRVNGRDACEVRSVVMSKLEEQGQWKSIKGVTDFVMNFTGNPLGRNQIAFSRSFTPTSPGEGKFYFYSQDPRFAEVETSVREIVTREQEK